jgi:butyryl-CoA dehydrogenase
LKFGEQQACHGYLIGQAHQGLSYMFMMMNEARVGVGLGAAVIGYRGYLASLEYARERPQGRLPSNRDVNSRPVAIVEHSDVKRMLLAQKAYVEGALCLCLTANRVIDDLEQSPAGDARLRLQALLDLLTPIVKSWPSEYGVKANDLAIQVLGGSGYTREYPVEQCYRDNRLNPIHEGTQGIQGLDLMGRKLWQQDSLGIQVLAERIQKTLESAQPLIILEAETRYLSQTSQQVLQLLPALAQQLQNRGPDATLANATVCLQYLGHWVVGWLWLQQAVNAALKLPDCEDHERDFLRGKIQACRYFYRWEMPQMSLWHHLLNSGDETCLKMENTMF